jgi:hypothetical protein
VIRSPFGVQDAPDPDGDDVMAFARGVRLTGSADDANAEPWGETVPAPRASLEGDWSSRWNAEGIDWQRGRGTLRVDGAGSTSCSTGGATKQGLIDACRDGPDRPIGRYLNPSDPTITRPWVGLIVDGTRIDGRHSGGRIDVRR